MVNSVRSRLDSQHGFTLIELLVVMIIISILMAVAVPVFLGQKQKALATGAKVNAKHIQDTIESCAASTTNGSLSQASLLCSSVAQVESDEQSLTPILSTAVGISSCATPPCITLAAPGPAPGGTIQTAYQITSKSANTPFTNFILTRSETNTVKTCTSTDLNVLKRMCPTLSW